MTDPIGAEAPALIGIGAEAIVDRAKSLGLTWTLRLATVTRSPVLGEVPVEVLYDGDTVPINCVNLTSQFLSVGERVMGMIVPPAGDYIIGRPDSQSAAAGTAGYAAGTANSAAITAEAVFLTCFGVILAAGRAYRIRVECCIDSSVGNQTGALRVRYTNAGGTLILGTRAWECVTGVSAKAIGFSAVTRNITDFDVVQDVVATISATTGNVTVLGSATRACELDIQDVGIAGAYPGASPL